MSRLSWLVEKTLYCLLPAFQECVRFLDLNRSNLQRKLIFSIIFVYDTGAKFY